MRPKQFHLTLPFKPNKYVNTRDFARFERILTEDTQCLNHKGVLWANLSNPSENKAEASIKPKSKVIVHTLHSK